MSYHILHQFDEQWLVDLKQGDEESVGRKLLNSSDGESLAGRRAKIAARESHRWGVIAAAILMATFALLFALDASRRAETLQQRLDAIEASIKK
ncbi:MAG: hypothetical protein QOJ02_3274 [Acidobacteriota bacterium]|jgi:hypothetical protein|nr:hypothetical protein [Acidobacteriota bacterium]